MRGTVAKEIRKEFKQMFGQRVIDNMNKNKYYPTTIDAARANRASNPYKNKLRDLKRGYF